MAMNQLYPEARHITVTVPDNTYIVAGMPVVLGGIAGVAKTDAKPGEKVTLWLDGSYEFTISDTDNLKPGEVVNSFFNKDGHYSNSRLVDMEGDPTHEDYLEVILAEPKNYRQWAPFGVVVRVVKQGSGFFVSNPTMSRIEVIPFGIHHPPIVPENTDS